MPRALADLDRSELIALIEHAGLFADPEALKQGWRAVLETRLAAAKSAYAAAYARWEPLSRRARIDAEAARTYRENRGFDEIWLRKFEESKASVRAAAEAWEKVRAAERERERIALNLRLVGKL
jgi:hypothetical protein